MAAFQSSCPECGKMVLVCDNDIWLDLPTVKWDGGHAQWTVMTLGGQQIASTGDPGWDGMAHTLHDHQPAEGSMA